MNNSLKIVYFDDDAKDETIKVIKKILDSYHNANIMFNKISAKNQPVIYKDLVKKNSNISYSIFVFGGHGTSESLLVKKKTFYDKNSFESGPKCLFAFCCEAGKDLGVSFANETSGSFLGFNRKIALDSDDVFIKWMQKSFYPVISEIFESESISEDIYLKTKDKLYEAHDYYVEKNFLRALCLGTMINALCHY